jgi:hypothetical protein
LNLAHCHIGDGGTKGIADSLKLNQSLTYLNLCDNFIRKYSAVVILGSLKDNNSLSFLDLSSNNRLETNLLEEISQQLEIIRSIPKNLKFQKLNEWKKTVIDIKSGKISLPHSEPFVMTIDDSLREMFNKAVNIVTENKTITKILFDNSSFEVKLEILGQENNTANTEEQ